jgi:superfamily II DNA helicase RecQ
LFAIATKLLRELGMAGSLISPLLSLMRNQISAAERIACVRNHQFGQSG